MNHDEKFQQRWEFRRRDDDRDSSDDSKSNSSGNHKYKKPNLITDLVILDDTEASDGAPGKLDTNNGVEFKTVKAPKKKVKPSTKKNVVKKQPRICSVKEKKGRKRNLEPKEVGTLEDLKIFADSLIREIKVARQKLSAKMREETRKLVASRSILGQTEKKKVRPSQKNKDHLQNGTESSKKPQNFSDGLKKRNVKSHNMASKVKKVSKRDQVLEMTNTPPECERGRLSKKARNTLADGSDQTVSLPNSTLPNVVPIPKPQNHRNGIPFNDCVLTGVAGIKSGSEIETGKLMDAKNYYHGVPAFQSELFGSFFHNSCKSVNFPVQNCSQRTSVGLGFPIPSHQVSGDGSNLSSQTYSENAIQDVGLRMNARFPALSPGIFPNNVSTGAHNASGEFVSSRLQDMKDNQFYQGLRNNSK